MYKEGADVSVGSGATSSVCVRLFLLLGSFYQVYPNTVYALSCLSLPDGLRMKTETL